MEWFKYFITQNFILVFVAIVMFTSSIVRYRKHPRVSIYTILIMICALALAVFQTLERYAKSIVDPNMTLVFSILGYTLRPTCVYLFYLLNFDSLKKRWIFISLIPLVAVYIIYFLAFVPELGQVIVFFEVVVTETGPQVSFGGGVLRFTSHVVAALYLVLLMYLTITSAKFKRLYRTITVVACVILIVACVVIESFFNDSGEISVLNTAIAFCVLAYYLYLNIENAEIDASTGLYNEEIYNKRVDRMRDSITGLIIFRLNLADAPIDSSIYQENYETRKKIAKYILNTVTRKMVVYRIEENTLLLVSNENKKETLISYYDKVKSHFVDLGFPVDMGYSFKTDKNEYMNELILNADRMIRFDKGSFRNTGTMKKL